MKERESTEKRRKHLVRENNYFPKRLAPKNNNSKIIN